MTTIKLSTGLKVTYDNTERLSHWRGFSKYPTTDGQIIGVCPTCVIGPMNTTSAVDSGIHDFFESNGNPRVTYKVLSGKQEE